MMMEMAERLPEKLARMAPCSRWITTEIKYLTSLILIVRIWRQCWMVPVIVITTALAIAWTAWMVWNARISIQTALLISWILMMMAMACQILWNWPVIRLIHRILTIMAFLSISSRTLPVHRHRRRLQLPVPMK